MNDIQIHNRPEVYASILQKSKEIGFTMPSDLYIGSLLKTLVTSKPGGRFLELGTGIGLGTSWIVDGMDASSQLTTVDNDPKLIAIARDYFGKDNRICILCTDGAQWLSTHTHEKFDLVFA
ncbi:MAG: methyltransferase domain-containing protein, partial [Bacteroidota bacterium]